MGEKGNGHGNPYDLSWSLESQRVLQAQLEALRQTGEEWMKQLAAALAVLSESLGAVKGTIGALENACQDSQLPPAGKA